MGKVMQKKKVQDALKRARELEKHTPLSREEVVKIYKEGISFGETLKKLLKPSWFVKDVHRKKVKKKKK
jgi:hypothetical protein